MKKQALTAAIAALFLVVVGVNSGFAKKADSDGTNTEASGSMHGHTFDSGKDFGKHVSEHAKDGKLGKDHNPGKHQGFSGNVNGK